MNLFVPYSLKAVIGGLFSLLLVCGLMKATSGAGFTVIFLVTLYAFAKNRSDLLLYALLSTVVLTVCNSFVAPKGMVFAISARLSFLLIAAVMLLQTVSRKSSRLVTPLLAILGYVAFQFLASAQGWQPIISYLKLLLFVMVFLAFFGMANAVHNRETASPQSIRAIVLVFACFLIFGSIALIPFPGIGKMGAAEAVAQGLPVDSIGLFQGITFQPQTLGPAVSIMSVLLFADLLFSIRKWDKLYLALLAGAPVLIYYTSSRTAMGTYLAGMFFTTFVFFCSQSVGARWKGRAMSTLTLVGVLGALALFSTPQMRLAVAKFALKWGTDEQIAQSTINYESLTSSRQGLMDSAMDNFWESPVVGNGFQVAKNHANMEIVSWQQLLSAPIEKGVWVTAILEEGGVLGMVLFCVFLVVAFYGLLSRRAFVGACTLFVFLVSNLGEFTFFSMSANGGLMWGMVFAGLVLDMQRLRLEQMAWRMPMMVPRPIRY